MQFCRDPTVAAAREKHLRLLSAAIHTCQLKPSMAGALTAMYSLDTQGRHIAKVVWFRLAIGPLTRVATNSILGVNTLNLNHASLRTKYFTS